MVQKVRRSTVALGVALLAMAFGACHPASPPVTDTAAPAPAVATAAPAPATSSPAAVVAPAPTAATSPAPPQPTEEAAMAESKTTPPSDSAAASAVPTDPSEVHRISLEQANALREAGTGVIVDVRDQTSYDMGHVKGAIHIAYADLAQHLAELPRDKPIVTYCA